MCAWVDNVCECTVRSCVCHMFHKTHESYFFRACLVMRREILVIDRQTDGQLQHMYR